MKAAPNTGVPLQGARAGAILLGNGVNRLTDGPSWEQLIRDLVSKASLLERGYALDFHKPFPLLFEEIIIKARSLSNLGESQLIEDLADHVRSMTYGPVHARLIELELSHILTTNYDLSLEFAGGIEDATVLQNDGLVNEHRYSLFRRYDLDTKSIWHIHGDVLRSSTIMLGYEHYSGALERVRRYVTSGVEYEKVGRRPRIARLTALDSTLDSWVDFFLMTDVHILGLSLDYVEMHLWWLLTYRARKLADGNKNIRGNLTYYSPRGAGAQLPGEHEGRTDLLSALGVEIREIEFPEGEWRTFYERALDQIEVEVGSRG